MRYKIEIFKFGILSDHANSFLQYFQVFLDFYFSETNED
jgi:hypothetical protein